ncbi:hypothetical protein M8J76_005581 [Diaphorina citri]|nr:hypothetical protein M8J75_003674 [Diaphorina citri]KAI5722227.1 hypothetical protein M8J76_005581 [Diaphorina citri]
MQTEWTSLVAALLGSLLVQIHYTGCQFAQSPYGVYPPTSFSTAGGGGSLLPFPLFPSPCEVGYITCEGPAGYIITNINIPAIPGPPAIPATTPRPTVPAVTTPRPTSPAVTTPRPTSPAVTTPRPTVPAPTTPRPTPATSATCGVVLSPNRNLFTDPNPVYSTTG